jgi:ATP-dependent Clp protease ATP-binding subunit ClpC
MFERYTEDARRALFFARYEASQLGVRSIETEHLLLGLLREAKGFIGRILAPYRINELRNEIATRLEPREKFPTSVEIPFSDETKSVMQSAAREADDLLHSYIGPEHLLLGLLREERSVAGSILISKGMRLESLRKQIADQGQAEEEYGEVEVSLQQPGTTARHRVFESGSKPWQDLCDEATAFATQIGPGKVISISIARSGAMSGESAGGLVVVWYWE